MAALDDAVLQHVQKTQHTNLDLADDAVERLVGVVCFTCPNTGWEAPRPGLLSMCRGRVKELWSVYRTLETRRKHLADLIAKGLVPQVVPKSVWTWIRQRDGVGW